MWIDPEQEWKSIACGRSSIARRVALFALLIGSTLASAAIAQQRLMTVADYERLPKPDPDVVYRYGDSRLQTAELRLPEGDGPHPVAIVVHGGCWLAQFGANGTRALSAAITEAGFATWNLEYRRLGHRGGGWPGTFEDVADGADHLRIAATEHALDLDRVLATGHSAGGQLALWLAARRRLPPETPVYRDNPIGIRAVVALAAVTDLVIAARVEVCGDAVPRLLGGSAEREPLNYGLTSPASLLPLGVPQILVHGARDPIVPPIFSSAYVEAARERGDAVMLVEIADAGHFELVAPATAAWQEIEGVLATLTWR